MSQYELVIFDWDGTLMDSTPDITRAIQAASADLGLPVPDDERASWVIGLSLQQALDHAVPDLTERDRQRFLDRYRYHYLARDSELKLFDGVIALLENLSSKGAMLAVATGKSRVGLNRAFGASGIASYFAATRCADETFGKPHPGMLLELMDELCVDPEKVVMIGDTSHDLTMAANASVHGLGVTYGAHSVEELRKHPHEALAHNVADLSQWLLPRV